MSFGGSISAMIASSKNNRALRKNHRKKWKEIGAQYHYSSKKGTITKEPKLSGKELEVVKSGIRKQAKRERLTFYIVMVIIFSIMVGLGHLFFTHVEIGIPSFLK